MMRIFVENLQFVGGHGVYEQERREGRRFRVDLWAEVDEEGSTSSDKLDETVDYRDLSEIALNVGQGPSAQLVEKMAGLIADRIFERYASVRRVSVTIRKWASGVPGAPQTVGVELVRDRELLNAG